MMKNKEKQFDCIKMKSSIQAQIYAETQNMSKEELLGYFNRNVNGDSRQNATPLEQTDFVVNCNSHCL